MLSDILITVAGLALLVAGGDIMVRGASALAARLGVSPLAIGLTVVAFGTSAPELFVNVTAAWRGNTELSFGNIFGSNMANIGLIIAITALIGPLRIRNVVISREVPMMMLATLVAAALALDRDDETLPCFIFVDVEERRVGEGAEDPLDGAGFDLDRDEAPLVAQRIRLEGGGHLELAHL